MSTFATTPRFRRDLTALAPEQRARCEKVVREELVPDVDAHRGRSGLRVKRVHGVPKVFEMTWAPDGRATKGGQLLCERGQQEPIRLADHRGSGFRIGQGLATLFAVNNRECRVAFDG